MIERITLPADRTSPAQAREWARPRLEPLLADSIDAVLCVSELVANAVLHAATPCEVSIEQRGSAVHVAVTDGAPDRLPEEQDIARWAVTGRGLSLLSQLSERWGVTSDEQTKTVWFEVPVSATGEAAPAESAEGSAGAPPAPLGDGVLLAMPAQLDLATAAAFREALDRALAAGVIAARIDGSGVEFIDSVGISVVMAAYERCHRGGGSLRITGASAPLRRTLETIGIADLLVDDGVDSVS